MARKRLYGSRAEKQDAYRRRQRLKAMEPLLERYEHAQLVHDMFRVNAVAGNDVAKLLLGSNSIETAINISGFLSIRALSYVLEEYAARLSVSETPGVKS
jgi:hypothetical protein